MLRATCDTNTLLRMAHAGPRSELYSAWRDGQLILVLSPAIYDELADVFSRRQTWRYVDQERGAAFLKLLQQRAEFVTPIAFSPNGSILASGTEDGIIWPWEMQQ